jgi:hypothetical protein
MSVGEVVLAPVPLFASKASKMGTCGFCEDATMISPRAAIVASIETGDSIPAPVRPTSKSALENDGLSSLQSCPPTSQAGMALFWRLLESTIG